MADRNDKLPDPDDSYRSPRRALMFVLLGLVVASLAVIAVWQLTNSDSSDTAAVTETTQPSTVSASDEDVTELPQNPSLRIFDDAGTVYVENDGNVTMSSIQVLDAAGASLCDLGTISPGDRAPCAEAADALKPIKATGSGPQGQPAESVLE